MMKDDHGRHIDYLRISLTDRCNFRCHYCMPEEGVPSLSHREILTYEEILRVVSLTGEMGVSKIRLTGGEPLVRKGVPGLIKSLKSISTVESVSLTTNGSLLEDMAYVLRQSGLDRINVSLDTLNREKFRNITRRDELSRVLNGIDRALDAGLAPLKINTVLMRGVNDDEVIPLIRYADEKGLLLRFIEQMPFNRSSGEAYIPTDEILSVVSREFGTPVRYPTIGFGPSVSYRFGADGPIVGVITPVSHHFCDRCNRMRLTADGKLKPCLLSEEEIDLRTHLRDGSSDRDLESIFRYAMMKKPENHNLSARGFESQRGMSKIGG